MPADVLAEVNTAVAVLENFGPAVTEARRQLDRATTVAWKAVNLIEVTDDEWQLVKRTIGIDRGWDAAGAGSQDDIWQGLALRRLPGPQQSLRGKGGRRSMSPWAADSSGPAYGAAGP